MTQATYDDVMARTGRDRLVATQHEAIPAVQERAGDLIEHRCPASLSLILILHETLVAKHDVVALVSCQGRLAAQTADDHIVTSARLNRVITDRGISGIQR